MSVGRLARLEAGPPPWGRRLHLERGRSGRRKTWFYYVDDATDVMSVDADARQARSSYITKTKTPASSLRQALLGRIRFGKTLSLGYVRRQMPGVINH